jgi:hypothetical protein
MNKPLEVRIAATTAATVHNARPPGGAVPNPVRWMSVKRMVPFLLVAALVVAGCGSSSSSSSSSAASSGSSGQTTTAAPKVHFAKTKFLIDAGLAFGTFHRWIYKPLKAGDFAHPLQHKATVVKAALAGAFVVNRLGAALTAAQGSPLLSKLVAPITALKTKLDSAVASLKGGSPDLSGLESANGDIGSISSLASQAGATIKEKAASGF